MAGAPTCAEGRWSRAIDAATTVSYCFRPPAPHVCPKMFRRRVELLEQDKDAVGVVAASVPAFNPRWACIDIATGRLYAPEFS